MSGKSYESPEVFLWLRVWELFLLNTYNFNVFHYVLQCTELQQPIIMPEPKKIDKLVTGLRQKMGLTLFGVDIIIENFTGRYAVIDINPFPSEWLYFKVL